MDLELALGFPESLAADFPSELPEAIRATDEIIAAIAGVDTAALAKQSPGLREFDWPNYLRCSIARLVHAAAALRRQGRTSGRLLDFGAYFGNFSLLFARLGFQVDAADAFGAYAPALDATQAVLRKAGVRVLDFDALGRRLEHVKDGEYDVVLCTGVIEHIPHTPRLLLESLNRVLKPGGTLLIDTPNLAHIYNRQKFARGESVHPELPTQYLSEPPFEGHHREFTLPELVWMLRRLGHVDVRVEAFNYSMYGHATLRGRDVINHWAMVQDPTMREYLLAVSTKPEAPQKNAPPQTVEDLAWREAFVDPEQSWRRALPPDATRQSVSFEGEQMVLTLQAEVNRRDVLIAEQQAEINRRDVEIDGRNTMIADQMAFMMAEVKRRDDIVAANQVERNEAVRVRDELIKDLSLEMDQMTRGWRSWFVRPRSRTLPK